MSSLPERRSQRRRPPRCRLLFDENLPWRVASALRELGYKVSYVGNEQDGAPPRGSSDRTIIDHARTTNQVVVTSNHDMILLCLEQPQPVIWLDPHGRKITRDEMVILVFTRGPRGARMRRTPGDAIPHRILRRPVCGPIQRRWGTKPSHLARHLRCKPYTIRTGCIRKWSVEEDHGAWEARPHARREHSTDLRSCGRG